MEISASLERWRSADATASVRWPRVGRPSVTHTPIF